MNSDRHTASRLAIAAHPVARVSPCLVWTSAGAGNSPNDASAPRMWAFSLCVWMTSGRSACSLRRSFRMLLRDRRVRRSDALDATPECSSRVAIGPRPSRQINCSLKRRPICRARLATTISSPPISSAITRCTTRIGVSDAARLASAGSAPADSLFARFCPMFRSDAASHCQNPTSSAACML